MTLTLPEEKRNFKMAVVLFTVSEPVLGLTGVHKCITNSIEHSYYWEANSCSASQEIPNILWNPSVHKRAHKGPPFAPNISQISPRTVPHGASLVYRWRKWPSDNNVAANIVNNQSRTTD